MKKSFLIAWPLVLAAMTIFAQPTDFPKLTGPCLGQKPPGNEFVRFAPDIIPPDLFNSITVSPDGKEIYWATKNGVIMVVKSANNIWSAPEVVLLGGTPSGILGDDNAPVVSPYNKQLFFSSRRISPSLPVIGYGWNIWCAERIPSGWGEPHPLPGVINNTGSMHGGVSITNSGTLYYPTSSQDRSSINKCLLTNGTYTTPEPINEFDDFDHVGGLFISPDESYIILGKLEKLPSGPFAPAGVFISFKSENSKWTKPEKLTKFPIEGATFITRDGKFIFCKSKWASAQIIEDLRPKE